MTVDTPGNGSAPTSWQVSHANEAFKRGWATRVAWSTVLSAAVHASALGALASWVVPAADVERRRAEAPLTLALTSLGEPAGGSASGPAAVALREVPAAAGVATVEVEGPAGSGLEPSAPTVSALWDRIAGGGTVTPTVVAPEPEPRPPTAQGVEAGPGGALDLLGARGSTAELVPELDHLMLDRLAVQRPELALTDPSLGVLVRNPLEIDAFMRRTYDTGELAAGESGLVGVALWIDERGNVRWAEIDHSSGRPAMDEVALELFREVAIFRPAREDGVAVSRSAIFWIRFPWVTGSPPFVPRRP